MASDTYYAWSPIHHGDGVVKIGEKVTASGINVDDDEFQLLIESGAIRTRKFPDDVGPNESVRERNIRTLAERMKEAQEADFDVVVDEEAVGASTPTAEDAEEVTKPK